MEVLQNSSFTNKIMDCLIHYARQSTCRRSKCSSLIVKHGLFIGAGFNSQPGNDCGHCFKDSLGAGFKSDKTCCVHAEQRAIIDSLKNSPGSLKGSIIYFIRLDENENPKPSGEPYCSICSKMALDVGIEYFGLYQKTKKECPEYARWHLYDTEEYNKLTFEFGK